MSNRYSIRALLAGIVGCLLGITGLIVKAQEGAPVDLSGAKLGNVRIEPASSGSAITFLPSERPTLSVEEGAPWDWSHQGALTFRLKNPNDRPVEFHVRLDDDASADGVHHCRTANGTIPPKATVGYAIPFGPDPMSVGVRALPSAVAGARSLSLNGEHELDLSHIVAARLFLNHPKEATTLILLDGSLAPPIDLKGSIDRFGQYAKADWPGKVHDEAELTHFRDVEAAELKAQPTQPDRDRFGGWATGPKQEATGFFRTAKVDGKWWLVDPDGRLFFSAGIDCVGLQDGTVITGREDWFSWLPDEKDPFAKFYGRVGNIHSGPVKQGRTFEFFRTNLLRKYGEGFEPTAREMALKRLPSWGFNTFANWSDPRFYKSGDVPFTATAGIGGNHARLASGSDYWGLMHDPFDPQFAKDVASSLGHVVALFKGDPWCVGYFVDNEISWGSFSLDDTKGRYGLALGALAAPATQPAKAAFIEQLRKKYDSIDKLNAAWGTSFADWHALAKQSWKLEKEKLDNKALQEDLSAFLLAHARAYFTVIRDELKKLDPDHLYLGCRFAWKTREAVQASDEICDINSFNIYDRSVDPKNWGFLAELKKPSIIGEFHVGALDRGMWHTGLQGAANQDERAKVFTEYVGSVLDNPALVGCHWFQYVDEPVTGRSYDGENYNIGFLTVTDTPYPEMVAAARAIHREMYTRRAGSKASH